MAQADLLRRDPEPAREDPLEADRDIAQPDRSMPGVEQRPGDDPDRVGEVDDPRVGGGPLAGPLGDVEHYRDRAQRLGEPAGARRLLADAAAIQRPGLVPVPRGLPADPQLQQHRTRAVEPVVGICRSIERPPDARRTA